MAKKKLVKVVFEYTDSIETLEDRPDEWLKEVNGYVVLQAIRTSLSGMSKYNWKITKK